MAIVSIVHLFQDGHSGYDFENRLNFRIHAALNNIEDMEYEMEAQAKLAPPVIDGLWGYQAK